MKQFEPMTDEMLFQRAALGEMPVPYQYGLHCLHRLSGGAHGGVVLFAPPSVDVYANAPPMVIDESSARLRA